VCFSFKKIVILSQESEFRKSSRGEREAVFFEVNPNRFILIGFKGKYSNSLLPLFLFLEI